ncbi:hypothetical protein NKG94_14375 [Micromonospora sp. M12]
MPLGVAMQGRAGAGKTHLLGAVREQIQRDGGYFFLVDMVSGKTFWESVALALVEGMGRAHVGWGTQLKTFLRRLTPQLGLPVEVRDAIAGARPVTRAQLDAFVWRCAPGTGRSGGMPRTPLGRSSCTVPSTSRHRTWVRPPDLRAGDPPRGRRGTERRCPHPAADRAGHLPVDGADPDPTVIAVDQLDTLLAQTSTSLLNQHNGLEDGQARCSGRSPMVCSSSATSPAVRWSSSRACRTPGCC